MGSSALSNSLNGGKVDVSLLNLDLTRTLLDTQGPVRAVIRDVFKWLGREGIDEADYQYCVERTAGLAYPNENGRILRQQIIETDRRPAVIAGIATIQSGAVGRYMASSEQHAYIVTTTVIASRFRSLEDLPTLLCEIVLANIDIEESKTGPPIDIIRMRLLSVLSKVIDSISLNVVNVGHSVTDFPASLQDCCESHRTDPSDFGRIVKELQRYGNRLVLLLERVFADLLLWIINHYQGYLEISVANKILHRQGLPKGRSRLEILIEKQCDAESNTGDTKHSCQYVRPKIELFEQLGEETGSHFVNRLGYARVAADRAAYQPAMRQNLYSMRYSVSCYEASMCDLKLLDSRSDNLVLWIAKQIVAWLVDLPLSIPQRYNEYQEELSFKVHVQSTRGYEQKKMVRLGHLLSRSPAILNRNVEPPGDTKEFKFEPHELEFPGEQQYFREMSLSSRLCERFPDIQSFMEILRQKCNCIWCNRMLPMPSPVDMSVAGCLRQTGLYDILLLVGHSIADGSGVPDASGMVDLDLYCEEVMHTLVDLTRGHVYIEGWLRLAIITALGITSAFKCEDKHGPMRVFSNRPMVGAQRGSLGIMARWMNLQRPLHLIGLLGVEFGTGRLKGVEDESAVIRSFESDPQGRNGGSKLSWDEMNALPWMESPDQSAPWLNHAVLAAERSHRILSIVGTVESRRVVSPPVAVSTLFTRNKSLWQCTHFNEEHQTQLPNEENLRDVVFGFYDFPAILQSWTGNADEHGDTCQITPPLDSHLKVNTALSTCGEAECFLLQDRDRICLKCLVQEAEGVIDSGDTASRLKVIVQASSSTSLVRI